MTLVLDESDDETRRPRSTPDLADSQASPASMDQYDDDEIGRARVLSNWRVLTFVAGYWRRRPWRVSATILVGLIAIAFETYMPTAASRIVEVTSRPPTPGSGAWLALGSFV